MVLVSQRRARVVRVARVADERGPRAHLDERRLDREERVPQIPELLLGLVDEAARRGRRSREERRRRRLVAVAVAARLDALGVGQAARRPRGRRRLRLALRAGFSFGFTLLFFQPIRVCRMKRAGYAWPVSVIKQRTRRYYYF